MEFLSLIYWGIIGYFGISVAFLLIYAILGLFYINKKRQRSKFNYDRRIVVMIPGYKEDEVIVNTAKRALEQNYGKALFDVIVVADSFTQTTLEKLKKLPISLIEVSFDKSTKSKALNKCMSQLDENKYEIAIILDADNIMEPNFLKKINNAFNRGFLVAQGHRTAKNKDSSFAILDACSEEINNNIYSKGHRVIGLSSRLVGSGMAFHYKLFKDTMSGIEAIGGFDKELELKLLKKGVKFEYINDAIVYDEKVSKSKTFATQRLRWISSQFHYARKYFFTGIWELLTKGNIDFFDKAFQMILPPRLLLPGILFLFSILSYFFQQETIYPIIWVSLFIGNILSFFISIPLKFYNKSFFNAITQIPIAFLKISLVMFKVGKANKKFIHTPHQSVYVDKVDNESLLQD